MESSPSLGAKNLRYSANTLSCFSHSRTNQVQLMDCSEAFLYNCVKTNQKKRALALKLTEEQISQKRKPLILVGPSGCGKSTYMSHMMNVFPNKFKFSVSYTTRAPRPGELDGVNYFFVTKEVM